MMNGKYHAIMLLVWLSLASASANSQQPGGTPEQLAALKALDDATPGTLINDPASLGWPVYGPTQTNKIIRSADIPGGGAAIRVEIAKGNPSKPWEVGMNAPISAAIEKGSDVTAIFWARSAGDKEGTIKVRFQQNADPYPGFGDAEFAIGKGWQQYEFTAKADRSIARGQAVVSFQLGGAKQSLEFGQMIVVSGATSIMGKNSGATLIDLHPKLVGKGVVLTDYQTHNWPVYGSGQTRKVVPAKEVPGGKAVQFSVAKAANAYDTGITIPIGNRIEEGEILLLAILARTVSADTPDGKARIGVKVLKNAPPYPGFAENMLAIGPNWGLYQIKTQARMPLDVGEGAIAVHLGGANQVVEIGQVYLLRALAEAPAAP
jgi:Carbohydrate binding domain